MKYLARPSSRIILGCFFAASLVLWAFPVIDLQVSSVLFDRHPSDTKLWWETLFHAGIGYFIGVSLIVSVVLHLINRFARKDLLKWTGRKVIFLFMVLIVGLGLIVNVALKDHSGRARPRDVEEFGGSKRFTPAFVLSTECERNCSFSSGEGAAGFFSLALAMALGRKRSFFIAAGVFGGLVSYFRLAAGAHFFSDVVVSFFVMLSVSDALYYYVVQSAGAGDEHSLAANPTLLPPLGKAV